MSCPTALSSLQKERQKTGCHVHIKRMTSNRPVITQECNMVHHYTKLHIFQNQEKINKEKEVRATITVLSDGLFIKSFTEGSAENFKV